MAPEPAPHRPAITRSKEDLPVIQVCLLCVGGGGVVNWKTGGFGASRGEVKGGWLIDWIHVRRRAHPCRSCRR